MTLRLRIFLFNLISIFLATFVVAIVGLKIVESTVIENTYQRLTQTRISKATLIENYFRDLQMTVSLVSTHELTDDLLFSKDFSSYVEFRHLLDNLALDSNIYDLILLNNSGEVAYSTRKDVEDGKSIVKDQSDENKDLKDIFSWGKKAEKDAALFRDFDKTPDSSELSIGYIASPVFRYNKVIGVIILKISISEIDHITSHSYSWSTHGMGQTGETLIYGEDWSLRNTGRFQVEAHEGKLKADNINLSNLGDENLKKIENQSEVRELGIDYRNQKVIRTIGKIYLPNGALWYIQTKIDKDEAFAVLDRIAIASSAVGILIFILFFFATFAATGKVVEPIQLLTERLEKLDTNNLTQKIVYTSRDEVGILVDKYNQLVDRLETTTVSKEFLDSVIQSIKALLFIVKVVHKNNENSCSYVISQANEAALKHLGLNSQQIYQTDLKNLINAPAEFSNYQWLLQTRHSIEAEIIRPFNQRTPILMNWAVLPNRTGSELTFVFVCTDITDRIATEQALIEAREQAVTASLAKSEFLARMSHEIRTPLNAIIGITDILSESELKPEQEQMVRVCGNAGENLLALINDILDISKIEAGEVQLERIAFDIEATTTNLCEILRQKAIEKSLEFSLKIELGQQPHHMVVGDPTRLRQILFNLIGNAVKFTENGRISVSLDFDEYDKKFLRFSITDSGIGIPYDKQLLLFQSFVQADNSITRKYGGSGLGLTISKNLVELMGGRIWLESEQGKGSTFYFTIPFQLAPCDEILEFKTKLGPHKETMLLQGTSTLVPRSKRILIVDDTDDNRFLLLTYLKKLPYEIIQAENGEDALNKVFTKQIDLILMDIQMPIMDGYEATRKIRQWEADHNKKPTPIIAVSANAMSEDVQRSLSAGCSEHVTKPIKKLALIEIIQKYMD